MPPRASPSPSRGGATSGPAEPDPRWPLGGRCFTRCGCRFGAIAITERKHAMQQRWVRFEHTGKVRFGTLHGDRVHEFGGDMFGFSTPTGALFDLADIKLLTPTQPSKVIALWNNFRALGEKLELPVPAEPLYLLKSPNS